MNKLFTILLFTSVSLQFINAQQTLDNKKNIIRINPLGTLASAIPLSAERLLIGHKFSVVFNYTIIQNFSGKDQFSYNNRGFAVSPELRHYLYSDQHFPARIYGGLFYFYEESRNYTYDRNLDEVEGLAIGRGGGIVFGNQWFFPNGFVVDFYVGPAYISYSKTLEYDLNLAKGGFFISLTAPRSTGTKVRFGFSVGIRF